MKKIYKSLLVIFALIALVAGGTTAYFSDTEVSSGNVFTAGSIDLKVDHTVATYNGVNCQTCGITVYSATTTQVIGANDVAVNQGPFPFFASLVENPNTAWLDASALAPAQWIWESPEVNIGDTVNNAEYTFEDTFFLQGPIVLTNFEMGIASDNGYKIELNGTLIVDRLADLGTFTGLNPLTSAQQTAFQNALLQNSLNSIQITVRNRASTSAGGNPAGLLYKIELKNEDCEAGIADFQQTCHLWNAKDLENEKFFNFSDVKPQDRGSNLISMHVSDNEAYLCLLLNNKEELENTHTAPEIAAGDSTPGALEGEMGGFLTFAGWYSDELGNKGDLMFGPQIANSLEKIPYADSLTVKEPLESEITEYALIEWCFGNMIVDGNTVTCDGNVTGINQAQTDAFWADLQFYAVQTRNNEEFSCADLTLPDQAVDPLP